MGGSTTRPGGGLLAAIYDRCLKGDRGGGPARDAARGTAPRRAGGRSTSAPAPAPTSSLYPDAVSELVLAEPDPHMLEAAAARRSPSRSRRAELVEASAEQLPFEDSSFDTAVFTLVLCTVPNPAAALAEAARVLKPGGKLLFVEHVRSEDAGPGPLAGPPRKALALLRRRLPLQPRHGGQRSKPRR